MSNANKAVVHYVRGLERAGRQATSLYAWEVPQRHWRRSFMTEDPLRRATNFVRHAAP